MRRLGHHFFGATLSKVLPPVAQVGLIALVAHIAGVAAVGRLTLASSMAFLCGALAEAGFSTSLSVPSAYFGTDVPPMRATRAFRVGTAVTGSVLYVGLWIVGIGQHDTSLLAATPLPAFLSLGYGYAGALNARKRMHIEGVVSMGELALTLGIASVLMLVSEPVSACLLSLSAARGVGAFTRSRFMTGGPVLTLKRPVSSIQLPFVGTTAAIVAQGQVDVLVLGAVGTFGFLGTYGPLLRCVYGVLLLAEAVSWGMMALPVENWDARRGWMRSSAALAAAVGCSLAIVVITLANPVLHLLIGSATQIAVLPLTLLAAVIPIRFFAFTRSVVLVRSGKQASRVPWLIVSGLVLAVAAALGARSGSFTVLASGRLCAESILAVGYALQARTSPSFRLRPEPHQA